MELNPLYLMFTCILSIIYVWTLYNVPVTLAGVRRLLQASRKERKAPSLSSEKLPTVSVLVPVKNEEKVVGRLLRALLNLEYPSQKVEIIIVDDGSTDKTIGICEGYVAKHPSRIRLLRRSTSDGKPSALNYGLKHVRGEIVATFDADNVPESDTLLKAVEFFGDHSVDAVQGTICSINADENMLTKFLSYEAAVRFKAYMQGKDVLRLFVPLAGTCQFIRRDVLTRIGGWSGESLSEDMEISARLTKNNCTIRYAPDIRSWEENPSTLSQLITQRLRWYRGCLDAAFKYGKLAKRPSLRSIDAEITLVAPCMLTVSFLGFLMGLCMSFIPVTYDPVFMVLAQTMMLLTLITLLTAGLALMYVTKPRRVANLLWLPFIYAYWTLQTFVASYALMQIVFRRPRKWKKTMRTGVVTNHALAEEPHAGT
jgi:cellulose synthase/poly-beta-1,6-N-acetylglucosamine synthase-like glycosyltransferase